MRRAAVLGVPAAVALAGCATRPPESCRTVPRVDLREANGPKPLVVRRDDHSNDPMHVAHLRCHAELGVQSAEIELARRYETGNGVPLDFARAATLYRRAAADIPRTTPLYSPPVRPGGSGRVILVQNPNARTGSAEARYRLGLMLIEGRGIAPDARRGRQLVERAAASGHAAARQWLAEHPRPSPN